MKSYSLKLFKYLVLLLIITLTACSQEQNVRPDEIELSTQSLQTIDATGLTAAVFNVKNDPTTYGLNFSNDGIKGLDLSEGNYLFCAPYNSNCLSFSIDENGLFQYDSSLDVNFDGAGTSSLIVNGFDIDMVTSNLSTRFINIKNTFGNGVVINYENPGSTTINLLPGGYLFCAPYNRNCLNFTVNANSTGGYVSFDSSLDEIFSGAGTNTLTVTGFAVTLQTSALSSTKYNIMNDTANALVIGYNNYIGTELLKVLPGTYNFCAPYNVNCLPFTVGTEGEVSYDPAYEPYFDVLEITNSQNSDIDYELIVTGVNFTVDTTNLSHSRFNFTGPTTNNWVGGYNNNGTEVINFLPGDYHFCAPYHTNCQPITVAQGPGSDGIISYDSALEPYFTGQGTSALTVSDSSTVYLDSNAPAGGNGLTPETAFNSLSDALALIESSNGFYTEIVIAEGTYSLE